VFSPLLLNIALHGMEQAAGVCYRHLGTDGAQTVAGTPALVRYADDFVVMCHTREQAEQARRRLDEWLGPRGLAFNEDKTRITHLSEGFDFSGSTSVVTAGSYSSSRARWPCNGSGNGSPPSCALYVAATPRR